MKRIKLRWFIWTAAALAIVFVQEAFAETEGIDNPYESIVDRNPFGLRPPPPPPDPNASAPPPPPAPLATVELTGITSILTSKRALLEIVPGPGKQLIRPILSEGERVESIEVVSIDVEKSEVVIKNGGVITNLALKVSKPGGAPTPPAQMAAAGRVLNPAIQIPTPAGSAGPTVFTPGGGSAAMPASEGRGGVVVFGADNSGGNAKPALGSPVTPNFGGTPMPTFGAGASPGAISPGLTAGQPGGTDFTRQIPSRTIRTTPPTPQPQQVDPAMQYINMRAQEIQARQKGVAFPPLPPIPGLEE